MNSIWTHMEEAGFLPEILLTSDPRPVSEQLNDRYAHGGGYQVSGSPIAWALDRSAEFATLTYPRDPPMLELSRATINNELCILFDSSFMAIVQPDSSFAVVRVD